MASRVEADYLKAVADTHQCPFYLTARFWKRFSVYVSVALSIASLVLSAIAGLKKNNSDQLKALTVSGIVINSISVAMSALTSLDWQAQATLDKKFAGQLGKIIEHIEGSQVGIRRAAEKGVSSGGEEDRSK